VCSVRHQTIKFHVIFVNISGRNTLLNVSQRSKSTLRDTTPGRLLPKRETYCSDTTGAFFVRRRLSQSVFCFEPNFLILKKKIKAGLCDLHAVCVSVYHPLSAFECLNQSL
jgi:hypothetical protein